MTNNNYNYTVTQYESITKPQVIKTISIDEVFQTIKNGDSNLPLIETARECGKGSLTYDHIKTNKLTTYRFNFLFKDYATNDNITAPTGLIYLDVDNVDSVPENEFIYAKWKSLSDTGYGILVKVDNLTKVNYRYVYNELTKTLGIESDSGARKATQQTVLSFDKNLYYNPNSKTYSHIEKEKVSSTSIIQKKEEGIGWRDTFAGSNQSQTIRFNNIDDYFESDTPEYIVFKEKEWICNPFIPRKIEEGVRNSILFFLLSQYALLNPYQGEEFLHSVGRTIISKMHPPLSEQELYITVSKVVQGRDNGTIEMFHNEQRRILFNPKAEKKPFKEIMQIVNSELGNITKEKNRAIIHEALESWDATIDGKPTQINLAKKTGLSLSTIKRYWKEFMFTIECIKVYVYCNLGSNIEDFYLRMS